MKIESSFINSVGEKVPVVYQDILTPELGGRLVQAVHAFCFYKESFLVVFDHKKGCWTPPGGRVEVGETINKAVEREVMEESNMIVLEQATLGFQDIIEASGIITQVRSVCVVEPIGPFVIDPDGDISEIKLIDPSEFKEYFDWGAVGDHLMERAIAWRNSLNNRE